MLGLGRGVDEVVWDAEPDEGVLKWTDFSFSLGRSVVLPFRNVASTSETPSLVTILLIHTLKSCGSQSSVGVWSSWLITGVWKDS